MARKQHADALFPNETPKYRAARKKLLKKEIALRRQIEAVAAERRKLPLGGVVREDYVFHGPEGPVKLSELFAEGKDTLLIYNFMYGPQMAAACPACTSILDGLNGQSQHVVQRTNFWVVAKSPIDRILAHARDRGWNHLRLLSSHDNTYNHDYRGENHENGDQWPMMNAFVRRRGRIYHTWASEMFLAPADKGQDKRHVDLAWPLWQLFDMTAEGRGKNWWPKLRYD